MNDKQQLAAVRAAWEQTAAEIEALANARAPAADLKRKVRADIDAARARFAERAAFLLGGCRPDQAEPMHWLERIADPNPYFMMRQTEDLVFYVHGDALLAKIEKQIDAMSFADAVPLEGRAARIAQLKNKLLALEIDEERIVAAMEAEGQVVARRPEIRGEVLLGIIA